MGTHMGILIDVVDASRIEAATAPYQSVNFVSLGEQQFDQVRAVLAGNASDQGSRLQAWRLRQS